MSISPFSIAVDPSQEEISLELINSWHFDPLTYSDAQLSGVIAGLFKVCNFTEEFDIPDETLSAVAHDVGHLGVNNVFLVKARHELAIKYNDQSPLENMHLATLAEVLNTVESNIFINLSDAQSADARKILAAVILGTDMSLHFGQLSKAQAFLESNSESVREYYSGEAENISCLVDVDHRSFMLELMLHFADISNPYKPFPICSKWAERVVEEFASQGDREKDAGMEVTPMMNRDLIILCNTQLGFIDFMVAPLLSVVIKIFPPLYEIGDTMVANYDGWAERRKSELSTDESLTPEARAEEVSKLDERVIKFREKFAFIEDLKLQVSGYPGVHK